MKREEFVTNCRKIKESGSVKSEKMIKDGIHNQHKNIDVDITIYIAMLAKLITGLVGLQCDDDPNMYDFIQDLSYVQWTVWSLQDELGISDEDVRIGIQASEPV